jgi:NADPH:quinone reductase
MSSEGKRMVDLTGSATLVQTGVHVDAEYIVRADGERLARVAGMIDEGQLRPEVRHVIAFERAPEALALVRGRHVRGKVVIEIVPRGS